MPDTEPETATTNENETVFIAPETAPESAPKKNHGIASISFGETLELAKAKAATLGKSLSSYVRETIASDLAK